MKLRCPQQQLRFADGRLSIEHLLDLANDCAKHLRRIIPQTDTEPERSTGAFADMFNEGSCIDNRHHVISRAKQCFDCISFGSFDSCVTAGRDN
mmetsp:Transcript_14896/g.25461  ORF Transcript_14896/g.25461 Transcript_14896/m.25461 type:complete len:94 (+) Transcript_14896:954-1235(+)